MEVDGAGDTDRGVETSLVEEDGEDEYSEGEIYRFADTSGMVGNEEEPVSSWYIDTLKGRSECFLSISILWVMSSWNPPAAWVMVLITYKDPIKWITKFESKIVIIFIWVN